MRKTNRVIAEIVIVFTCVVSFAAVIYAAYCLFGGGNDSIIGGVIPVYAVLLLYVSSVVKKERQALEDRIKDLEEERKKLMDSIAALFKDYEHWQGRALAAEKKLRGQED